MKQLLLIIVFISCILSCTHKNRQPLPVKIYTLSPYEQILQPSMEGGDVDSSFWGNYIVYNLPQTDAAYLKKILKPFTNSVIQRYPKPKFLQMDFYKPSKNLDTNYWETKYNQLYTHREDLLVEIGVYHNKDTLDYTWIFYRNGKIIE